MAPAQTTTAPAQTTTAPAQTAAQPASQPGDRPGAHPADRARLSGGHRCLGTLLLPDHRDRPTIGSPEAIERVVRPLLAGHDRERCLLLSLDVRTRLVAVDLVSVGTAASTFMSPREVFRDALLRGATSVVLAHNHPSGDPAPSAADRAVTRRLARAGTLLGIPLLDHLVLGDTGATSLAREGEV